MYTYLIPYQGDLFRIILNADGSFHSATYKPTHDSYRPEPIEEDDTPIRVLQKAQELFTNETGI